MSEVDYKKIIKEGLWDNNPALIQMLGLCPLLAVTTNVVNGFGLGMATLITLMISNFSVSLVRDYLLPEIRIPIYVLIIAVNVTVIELLMQAFFHDLYTVLGIFIPLIVTNCIIIGRAEAFASRNNVASAWLDGIMMSVGFMAVLIILGGMRELLANGTLFDHAHLMFGEIARDWTITLSDEYQGFLFAALPPGAFMGLAFILAFKNYIDQRATKTSAKTAILATD